MKPLLRGQEVLLFLTRHTNQEKVGSTLYDVFCVSVGMDNRVFDVREDGEVAPHLPEFFSNSEYALSKVRTQEDQGQLQSRAIRGDRGV